MTHPIDDTLLDKCNHISSMKIGSQTKSHLWLKPPLARLVSYISVKETIDDKDNYYELFSSIFINILSNHKGARKYQEDSCLIVVLHCVLSQIHVDHQICMYISCHCHINDLVILVNFNFSSVSMVNLDSLYEKTYILTFQLHLYCVLSLRYGKDLQVAAILDAILNISESTRGIHGDF